MRILITLLVLVSLVTTSQSQLIVEDGLYYNKSGELYSGTYVEYYPSGNKRVEMTVVEGKKQGVSTYYFDNKLKQEVRSYKDNEMDGLWETWNKKGVKLGVASYKNGTKHGKWYIYDEAGILRYDMEYKEGEKVGTWKIFDENGKLEKEKKY